MARCIEKQIAAMNAALYPNNEVATEEARGAMMEAGQLNDLLDLLDDLSNKEQEWWTVRIEPRR